MKINITAGVDRKGKWTCLYIGDSSVEAIKTFREATSEEFTRVYCFRRARATRRRNLDEKIHQTISVDRAEDDKKRAAQRAIDLANQAKGRLPKPPKLLPDPESQDGTTSKDRRAEDLERAHAHFEKQCDKAGEGQGEGDGEPGPDNKKSKKSKKNK